MIIRWEAVMFAVCRRRVTRSGSPRAKRSVILAAGVAGNR